MCQTIILSIFTCTNTFNPHYTPRSRVYYYPHSTDQETEATRRLNQVTEPWVEDLRANEKRVIPSLTTEPDFFKGWLQNWILFLGNCRTLTSQTLKLSNSFLDSLISFFFLFRAASIAHSGSQARGQIGATAASLCHSHSNAGPTRRTSQQWPH